MKFQEIPMLTSAGLYEINTPLNGLERTIDCFQEVNEAHYPLDLMPDFQRGHVWNESQQIAYVEFFLKGGMTGRTIYLNCPNWGSFCKIPDGGYKDFVIVDGLQRLTALLKFVRGEISAFNHYVQTKDNCLNPVFFFEDKIRMSKACDNLRININNLKTKKEVLQWYLEMNSGSTPHTQTELDKVRKMLGEY